MPQRTSAYLPRLDRDGYLYTWGENRFGRLGCGTQCDQLAPVRVAQFAQ